jgi:protein involved in polysaccharide export with SLBB domain
MKSSTSFFNLYARATSIAVIGLFTCTIAASQTYTNRTPNSAIPEPQSRAKEKADDIVSLSPDKIVSLLRQEAGLLLQVKKELVKQAYAQGRILGAEDLTDESLFRLIEQDERVRITATREIEERGYISVNPTREEVQAQNEKRYATKWVREKAGRRRGVPDRVSNPEGRAVGNRPVAPSYTAPLPEPEYLPAPLSPQYPAANARRQLVSSRTQAPDYLGAEPGTLSRASRTQTEQLPEMGAPVSRDGWAEPQQGRMPDSTIPGSVVRSPAAPNPTDTMERSRPSLASGPGIQTSWSSNTPAAYHLPHPYSDLPSFYDLHWKYSRRSSRLARFGEEVFRNRTGELDELPADIPAGRDYVVGPGDGLTIELWGGVSQRLQRVIDREGRLSLPEAGPIQVAGRNLGELQQLVQTVMRTQFHDVQADVSLSRLRTVHIYVVGDVERPGAYDVSSLSSLLNALYLAGGPTPQGSMRVLGHYRDKQLVQRVDLYDLLLHGIRSSVQRLEPGDVVQVSPLGAQVAIEGMVRRPAIYELNGETNLADVLELAGGVLPSASLRHVDVERTEVSHGLTRLGVDIPEDADRSATEKQLSGFTIKDGDKIKISPVLPHADKTVYLDGHVFRPGKFAYHEGMQVRDLIHSYDDLLPEPSVQHAEIIRLNPPDYTPTVLTFNLANALAPGEDQTLVLKPFDTVRIFSRFDFEDPPVVTVSGEVRDPGDHLTNGAIHLRDAIYLAGGATPDTLLEDAQIFRNSSDGKLRVISVNLAKALAGDENENLLLAPKDRVVVHPNPTKSNPPMVTIQGEVANPGKYPLDLDMTAAALVRLAGGFQRGAYTQAADLTSHNFSQGKRLLTEHRKIAIAEALEGRPDSDVRLHDGDVLTIGRLEGWKDLGATVTLQGEVVHPGIYGIDDGERLSSVIERAGGLRAGAYPYGTVFERAQVRELEEKNRAVLIREVQDQEPSLVLAPDNEPQQKAAKQAVLQQWKGTLEQLQNTPPPGRLVIHISSDLKRWANSSADIPVRAGDFVYVPKKPNMIVVNGSVYNPTAISFKPGKDTGWYLQQAGGPTAMANKKAMFVIRADGSVAGGSGGLFSGGVERTALQPGDMVVVPEKAFSTNTHWKTTLEGAQLASAVGIAIQVARSF